MSTPEISNALPAGLKDRVINIITRPKTEWPVIEAEATNTGKLYREYIGILAIIPAVCSFIGFSVIGISLPIVGTFRIGIARGLANAVVTYVLTLVGAYVSAFVIDKLAPSFESKSDQLQALKLVAYASTPVWIGGLLNIIPALAVIGIIIALYAIYLFYLGLPVLMKTPPAKVIPYMVVAAVVIIVVTFVVGMLANTITGTRMGNIPGY
ncbi:MAG: YIP1 family protein [Gemmatimonadetes bacterium]|nr:YIP1 family protein [Gemmatimonadota bacterium]